MKADHTWRGMLIKDNEGDWGICVAAWRGMKKGKPGIPGIIPLLLFVYFRNVFDFALSCKDFKCFFNCPFRAQMYSQIEHSNGFLFS